ncbi:ATP-binding protein [Dactylosporangium roseum]|uniref:ATP-binding protein n=1 Tax=Dactylosporangium roseum TaxID=47989 RepID=A0ABY5Z4U7_9ACTN|nr:ATP-binding protein [Dactylosporangium roseum]UWZ35763.1 ATP-binding protein [Dactylosporangium roseum]
MEIRLSLSLPRDRSTVPLTRRVLDAALAVFAVTRDCREDIGLAVGEACANAVQHATAGADYEVTVTIQDDRCIIDVVDDGLGLESTAVPEAPPDAETGRGLRIIHALADMVELRRRRRGGVALRIVKLLTRSPATV